MRRRIRVLFVASTALLAFLNPTGRPASAFVPAKPWLAYSPTGQYLHIGICCGPIARWPNVRLDAEGIPTVSYDQGKTYVYNPVTVAWFGLQGYSWWLRYGKFEYRETALAAANWLIANQRAGGKWLYNFDYPVAGMDVVLRRPWSSSMAQGLAISLLTRVSTLKRDPRYLAAARDAVQPLRLATLKGGHVAKLDGRPYYETYPTTPASFTLNGFMYTLIGLYDLEAAVPASDADKLYAQGSETLRHALPLHDLGAASAYHLGHVTKTLRAPYTNARYHRQHVMLLRALESMSPGSGFAHYAERWATYPACATDLPESYLCRT